MQRHMHSILQHTVKYSPTPAETDVGSQMFLVCITPTGQCMHSHVRIYTVKYTHSHKSVTINIYCQRAHSNTKHNTDSVNAQLNTIFKTGSGKVG